MGEPESRSQFATRRSSPLLGVSDPESGSNIPGLRRSPRLCNIPGLRRSPRLCVKSAMIMSQSTQMASCKPGRIVYPKRRKPRNPKPKPKRLSILYNPYASVYFRGGASEIDKFVRCMRKAHTNSFRYAYDYNPETSDRWDKITEKRFIVVSGKEYVFPNVGRSHGISWVGVHGIGSTCAVFLNEEPDMQRILDSLGDSFITDFLKYVLSDLEDSPPYSNVIGGKPFAVVSLPDFSNVDEESRHEASAATINAQGAANKYLVRNICSNSDFSNNEAEKIAISAFQRLCGKKFKADEIVVCTFHENDGDEYPWALTTSEVDSHFWLISIRRETSTTPEIDSHMAVIDQESDENKIPLFCATNLLSMIAPRHQ